MRNILIFLALAALVYNVYALNMWLFAFFNSPSHAEAVSKYQNCFPAALSLSAIHWISIVITVLSVVVLSGYKDVRNHRAFTGCIVVQGAFLLLYTWQSL